VQGDIDLVVSDHSPCTPDLKLPGSKVALISAIILHQNNDDLCFFHFKNFSLLQRPPPKRLLTKIITYSVFAFLYQKCVRSVLHWRGIARLDWFTYCDWVLQDFMSAWGGISSLQFGLSLFWSQAKTRGLDLTDVNRLLTLQPARLAGS
jgi:hypothetical protein